MMLAIDAGNTRVKWGLHDGARWRHQGDVATAEAARLDSVWQGFERPEKIVGCNVAADATGALLNSLARRWRRRPQWIAAVQVQCGVRNSYDDPAQLGPDRWAALIGAWHLMKSRCLVVNAGTAMTVDALSGDGVFLGGIIVPGFELMGRALAMNTERITLKEGQRREFPTNTEDGVFSGALAALGGAVERMANALGRPGTLDCIVSGGAARPLASALTIRHRVVDNLVLDGLVIIARS